MKTQLACFVLTGAMFIGSVRLCNANDALAFWLESSAKARIAFNLADSQAAELQIENNKLSVRLEPGTTQILTENIEPLHGEILVQIDDFNFDGWRDIAVLESYGYGGVNVFSAIYAYDTNESSFRHLLTESNIRADDDVHELHADQRSGPRYYTSKYRFQAGHPYLYRQAVQIGPELEKNTLYDAQGSILKTAIVDQSQELSELIPARRRVLAERAYLYHSPDEQSKTRGYVIRGDEVELLDSAGDWDQWFLIRYRGKSTIERWIKSENIFE